MLDLSKFTGKISYFTAFYWLFNYLTLSFEASTSYGNRIDGHLRPIRQIRLLYCCTPYSQDCVVSVSIMKIM